MLVVLVLWFATLESGVHASIAGMLSGLLVPALDPRRSDVEDAARSFRAFRQSPMPGVQRAARRSLTRAISVNERLQEALHSPTSHVVVPVFALANAGVDLRDGVLGDAFGSRLMWGIVLGLVVGKALGIFAGALGERAPRAGPAAAGRRPGPHPGRRCALRHRLHGLVAHHQPRLRVVAAAGRGARRRPGGRRTREPRRLARLPLRRPLPRPARRGPPDAPRADRSTRRATTSPDRSTRR